MKFLSSFYMHHGSSEHVIRSKGNPGFPTCTYLLCNVIEKFNKKLSLPVQREYKTMIEELIFKSTKLTPSAAYRHKNAFD